MSHPQKFDDDDAYLARVRELCHAFPDVDEKISHGRPAFFTKKIFAYFGGSVKVDDEWVEHPRAIMVQPDSADRAALSEDPRSFVPAYLGPSGWIGIDLDPHDLDASADGDTDWDEVVELLDASFRLTAPKRSVDALDEMSSE